MIGVEITNNPFYKPVASMLMRMSEREFQDNLTLKLYEVAINHDIPVEDFTVMWKSIDGASDNEMDIELVAIGQQPADPASFYADIHNTIGQVLSRQAFWPEPEPEPVLPRLEDWRYHNWSK